MNPLRNCLLPPVPELFAAAKLLHQAALAHVAGDRKTAAALIAQTDSDPSLMDSPIFDWSETLFAGKKLSLGKTICPTFRKKIFDRIYDPNKPEKISEDERDAYIPSSLKTQIVSRQRYFCRYCNAPVINPKVKNLIRKTYSNEFRWGSQNIEKHVVFQALELQFDHVVPESLGGLSTEENLIVSCASCNCGKSYHTLTEMRLTDPRDRKLTIPEGFEKWDGLSLILR